MADYPFTTFHKPNISTLSAECIGPQIQALAPAAPASAVWPSANLALFLPFKLDAPYLVRKVWWLNGATVTGNTDVGVYTLGGTLLFSSGATATAGVSSLQSVTLGTPVLLEPGSYYLAMSCSLGTNTTQRFSASPAGYCQVMGMASMAAAQPLPASATLATVTTTYVPVFGISNAAVL